MTRNQGSGAGKRNTREMRGGVHFKIKQEVTGLRLTMVGRTESTELSRWARKYHFREAIGRGLFWVFLTGSRNKSDFSVCMFRDLSVDLLQMIPDNHILLAKLCALYPGSAADIDGLRGRVSVRGAAAPGVVLCTAMSVF